MGCFQSTPDKGGGEPQAAPAPRPPPGVDPMHEAYVNAKHVVTDSTAILKKPTPDVRSLYDFGQVLGKGQFGTTRLVTDKRSGAKLACKTISKRKLTTPEDIGDVQREIQIMLHLAGHPNVVQLTGAYEDKQNIHLVMELCSGGELFDRIVERHHYTERDAAELIRTIVKVVHHCHQMAVIHRDLKPENFLLQDKSQAAAGSNLKATDFGLSVFFKDEEFFKDIVGSAYYVAPEVLRRKYSKEADIWSCGVILYILLCGVPPFYGDSEQQIFEQVIRGELDLSSDPWPKISQSAKDVVTKMLTRDVRRRATAAEVLQHDWIKENGVASDNVIEPEVLKRMRGFAAMNKLKKEALKVIAGYLPADEIEGLKELFQSLDADRSGFITVQEMRDGLRKKGSTIPAEDLEAVMASADIDGDGKIDYKEFLAATIHQSKMAQEENLYKAFKHFDSDGSGYITRDELAEGLKSHGTPAEVVSHIDQILNEVDKDKDGRIDYEEFTAMMHATNDKMATASRAATRRRNPISFVF